MKKYSFRTILSALLLSFYTVQVNAQTNTDWLENTMFSSGKINVVVAVVSAIFILLIIYLISIDRKLSKIEKNELNDIK